MNAPDAALLAACAAFLVTEAERVAMNDEGEQQPDDISEAENQDYDDRCVSSSGRWRKAIDRVIELPATTPTGFLAKAEAMRIAVLEGALEGIGDTIADARPHERLAYSMAQDILRELPTDADAGLLALCSEFGELHSTLDSMEPFTPAYEVAQARWWALLRLTATVPAVTPEGIRAKAGLWLPAMAHTVEAAPFTTIGDQIAASLVRDLIGGAA
jgi:hypothetical protein